MVVEGVELRIDDVLSYRAESHRSADIPIGVTQLRFRDGVVLARVTPDPELVRSGSAQSSLGEVSR
jgi:hypothetical protein